MTGAFNWTKEHSQMINHMVIALCCLPLYRIGGEAFKLLLLPYILYLVFCLQPKFIPALLLHFMDGTTMSLVILLGCLITSVKHIKVLKYYKVLKLLILALVPLPFIMRVVYLRLVVNEESLASTVDFLFMYFGLFSFFYFVLIAHKFKIGHIKYLVITLFLTAALSIFYPYTIRYNFFTLPLLVTLLTVSLKRITVSYKLFFSSLLILPFLLSRVVTTTIISTSIISALIAFNYFRKEKLSARLPYVFLASTVLIVLVAILNYDSFTPQTSNYDVETDKIDLFDASSIYRRSKYKLLEDRMPIWYSVYYNYLIKGDYAIPVVPKNTYSHISILGTESDSTIPAHNIFLELVRNYGIIGGITLSLIYMQMIVKSSFILRLRGLNIYLVSIACTIITCGFLGGMIGQYLLLGTFSFLFMGFAGLCYGFYYISKLKLGDVKVYLHSQLCLK